MKIPLFTGSCTAMVTPYLSDGIDYQKMGELLDFQYDNGTSAVIICGTTGENATQPIDEHEKLVDFCCRYNDGRMKVIAGIGSNDTMTSVRLATSSKASGVDGVLMVTPYYNKTTQAGLVQHFSYVADHVDVPLILYNVPSRTGVGCTAETYKILSENPNINGVKEASGDMSLFVRTRAMCGDDLNVWSGNDDQTIPMMSMGCKGVVSVVSNIFPRQIADLCQFCLDGNLAAASEIYYKYYKIFDNMFIEVNPIPVKTAMNLMGFDVGIFRLPLVDMAPENLAKLKASLLEVGAELK